MSVIIQTENLHHRYPDEEEDSLKGVDLSIEKGSFVAILGHNGSGKSTLAKHFNGILTPTEGKVWINGMDTSDDEKLLAIRQTVGMVFQNPDNQIVANVVEDDVAFAPENLGVPSEEIRQRVDSALKQVGMYEYRMHAPHLLSGGQKQRVAIAGVIAMEPEVIVLDEPTAMLDPLITHHMNECVDADRLVVMSGGRIIADDTPAKVFSQVSLMESEGLTVPATTQVLNTLNQQGYDFPLEALTVEQCAAAIAANLNA